MSTLLDKKLNRIETGIDAMRTDFGLSSTNNIEDVVARAIAGPQAEECMRICDLMEGTFDESNYSQGTIERVAELIDFYLKEGDE